MRIFCNFAQTSILRRTKHDVLAIWNTYDIQPILMCKAIILLPLATLILTACSSQNPPASDVPEASLSGSWTEPVPGMPEMRQGFELADDGTATSIGMATLQYERWSTNGDTLFLDGKSIGNGQSIQFTDTLIINSFQFDSLVVQRGQLTSTYTRP